MLIIIFLTTQNKSISEQKISIFDYFLCFILQYKEKKVSGYMPKELEIIKAAIDDFEDNQKLSATTPTLKPFKKRMWVLCHYKRKEESPDCTLLRFGDSFCVLMELSYLFAYRHYSICKNFWQYAFFYCPSK